MKVLVLWENSAERALADNLVNVLRKIGAMLVYGKVNETGVLLEDWKSKPKVTLECLATQLTYVYDTYVYDTYGYEMPYVDGGYYNPSPGQEVMAALTREVTRDMVRMFPDNGSTAKTKKTKPVVPKPDTTPTGVTVRQLDIYDDEDKHDDDPFDDDPFGMDED